MQQLFFTALLLAITFPFSSLDEPCVLRGGYTPRAHRADVLKVINEARTKLANGEQPNGPEGKNLPKGDIDVLTWSCDLEQKAADILDVRCSSLFYDEPNGTTFFRVEPPSKSLSEDSNLVKGIEIYLRYIDLIGFKDTAIRDEYVAFDVEDTLMEFYAYLVREDVTEIGCAVVMCADTTIVQGCLVNQPHLTPSAIVYHVRATATSSTAMSTSTRTTTPSTITNTIRRTKTTSSTPTSTSTMTNTASTITGMTAVALPQKITITTVPAATVATMRTKGTASCIPRRKATTAAASPQSPAEFPQPSGGSNEICPENVGMHDSLRTKFLDMHNYRRAELAKGNIVKLNGNYLPQASDMQKMRYDCALEREVVNYIRTCPSNNSAESLRCEIGENFIRFSVENLTTYLTAVDKAVSSWWKVIRTEEGPGLQVYFRQKHVGTPIESFTQMAWSTSSKLGCAIAKCGGDFVTLCRYSPRGNYVEQVIYKRGTPCTGCATGSWCTEDALCTLD